MFANRSRRGALIILVATPLVLAACGSQLQTTEQPDPPSWFAGELDRSTHEPPQEPEASVAVGDSAFRPATLIVRVGEPVRIENTGTGMRTFTLDGADMAVVEPGGSKVVPIDLKPGRYGFSSREDPSVAGTLIVT
jgi:hypothetical protein